ANVVAADVEASNGVIPVIDDVILLPQYCARRQSPSLPPPDLDRSTGSNGDGVQIDKVRGRP
ncbi:MAG: fasciclin domain-containing protein, partial [Caldilineaceae bacterium]|nr:fasciclin domain-containing protein [Caldilineaceae bacterium]